MVARCRAGYSDTEVGISLAGRPTGSFGCCLERARWPLAVASIPSCQTKADETLRLPSDSHPPASWLLCLS